MTLMTVSGFNSSFTEFIIHLDFHAGKFQLMYTSFWVYPTSIVRHYLSCVHVGRKGCLQPTGVSTAVTVSYVVVNNGAIN